MSRRPAIAALIRLLAGRAARAMLGAHLGGVALVALVTLVEGSDLDRVPAAWAALAPVLALLGGAWVTLQLRRGGGLLALACAGWSPRWSWLGAGLAGVLACAPAAVLLRDAVTTPVAERVEGGWWRPEPGPGPTVGRPAAGRPAAGRPDVPEGPIAAPPVPVAHRWRPLVGGTMAVAGAACGAMPEVLVVAGAALVADVVARGAASDPGAPTEGAPALLALGWVAVAMGRRRGEGPG